LAGRGGGRLGLFDAAGARCRSERRLADTGRDAHIKFASCGQAYCGTVVWLRDPLDPETKKPILDKNNPDPGKRRRPVLGIAIGLNFKAAEGGKYVGQFYNSDDGQTYNGNIVRTGASTLKVEGCLGALCQTQVWTKAAR
jgi:uncharacterized protein (DUF2147 family)